MISFSQSTLSVLFLSALTSASGSSLRHLQDGMYDMCVEAVTELAQCYAFTCSSCEMDFDFMVSANSDCAALTESFCESNGDECCPDCAAQRSAYNECIVSSFLQEICPGSSCGGSDGNTDASETTTATLPEGNTTVSEGNTTLFDGNTTAGFFSGMTDGDTEETEATGYCSEEISNVFMCYLTECTERECESDFGDEESGVGIDAAVATCDDFNKLFCSGFDAANACCPECTEQTTAYSSCIREQFAFCTDGTNCGQATDAFFTKSGSSEQGEKSAVETEATTASERSSSSRMASFGALFAMGLFYLTL